MLKMHLQVAEGRISLNITCSQRGVLKTLCLPNLSANPVVQRKTPPKLTSSPNTYALQGYPHEFK